MRRVARIVATAFCWGLLLQAGRAGAQSLAPALERLRAMPCLVGGASGTTEQCGNLGFARLISEYGFAFAPPAMNPARTTGPSGFQIALQSTFSSIDSAAAHWSYGTRGYADESTGLRSIRNSAPDSFLQLHGINVRKGLPFGFELGGTGAIMPKTALWSFGADLRWALFEGFRSGLPGYLPDLAVGAGVRTVTGTAQFQLSVASVEAVASKPLPIDGASVLTPYLGYQFARVFGDSGTIDLTPNVDAVGACNYTGSNAAGQPTCEGGTVSDFRQNASFDRVRLTRHRLFLGIHYRHELLVVGGHVVTDMIAPASANSGADAQILEGAPRQVTFALQAGIAF